MENFNFILEHYKEIIDNVFFVLGAFSAFLLALYKLFLLIPGNQPEAFIKKVADFTSKISRK